MHNQSLIGRGGKGPQKPTGSDPFASHARDAADVAVFQDQDPVTSDDDTSTRTKSIA